MDNISAKEDIVLFQGRRSITNVSKFFLDLLEDLLSEGYNINYTKLRKKILDKNGDTIREFEDLIKKLEI